MACAADLDARALSDRTQTVGGVEASGMSRPEFQIPVRKEKGEFAWPRQRFQELAARLADGDYLLSLEKFPKRGSGKQRRYYFAVVVRELGEYWGVDDDTAHELIKLHCNKQIVEVVNKQTGQSEEQVIGGSTAGFTTEQWTAYIARCHEWAATEFGFVIPDPDPEWMFNKR